MSASTRSWPAGRSCGHLVGAGARQPAFEIGNEFFGIGTGGDGAGVLAERTHCRDVSGDLAWLAHRLRVIAGEDELGARQFLQAEAHPMAAEFGGAVRAGPAGNVVKQAVIKIMIERLSRPPAMARQAGGAPLLARLKAADATA